MSAWEKTLQFKAAQEAVAMASCSSHCSLLPHHFLSAYSQTTEKLIKNHPSVDQNCEIAWETTIFGLFSFLFQH